MSPWAVVAVMAVLGALIWASPSLPFDLAAFATQIALLPAVYLLTPHKQ